MNSTPLEIEYKFLIEIPDLEVLSAQPDFCEKHLTQMYLALPAELNEVSNRCRIRKTAEDGKVTFFKTFKKSLTDLTRVEIEEEIGEEEYTFLSRFILDETAPVEKTRLTFTFEGFTLEVDIFPFWQDKAFLEIEVESEGINPPIPPFIKVIKDVSADKTYRNFNLAKGIFKGTLI